MAQTRDDELVPVARAAEMLGVKVPTVRRMTRLGELPFVRPTGRRTVRYKVADLQELIRRRSHPAAAVERRSHEAQAQLSGAPGSA